MANVKVKVDERYHRRGRTNFAKVRSLSEAELNRRAQADPDCPPLSAAELAEMERVPDVKAIRRRLGLSQVELSRRFRLSLKTVQDWEQGRYEPDQASRTLLRLIARIPRVIEKALAGPKRAGSRG
jgi:putative transcriptional regulator